MVTHRSWIPEIIFVATFRNLRLNVFLVSRLSAESPQIRMAPEMASGEVEEDSGEYCLSWNGYNEQLSVVFRELCKVRKLPIYAFFLTHDCSLRSNFSWM